MKQKIEFETVIGSMPHPNASIDLITYTFKGDAFNEFTLASEVELEQDQLNSICIQTLCQDGICDHQGYYEPAIIIEFPSKEEE